MMGRMALIVSLTFLATVASCVGGNSMEQLQTMWAAVIDSPSAVEEREAVAKFRKRLAKEKIAFKTVIIDDKGTAIPYSEFKGEQRIKAIRFTFLTRDGEFQAPEWSPKHEENFYAFFRE